MQNWLAGEEPDLFFGSPPATPARSAAPGGEPFGKIVFAQRLEVGDLVHVLQADGVSVHAPGEVVDVQVADMNEMPLYHVRYVDPGEGASPYTPQAPTVHAFQAEQLQRAPLAAGESQRSSLFECKMRWHRRHAGRTMELPARGVCRSGDVLLLDAPIRFTFPKEPPAPGESPSFIVKIALVCQALEVSFTHLITSPWSSVTSHWVADGGLVSPAEGPPAIKNEYAEHKPPNGPQRETTVHKLPTTLVDALGVCR